MPTKPMRDVMVDLETLGTRPGCIILSVGAVLFEPEAGALGERMYEVVNAESCAEHGLTFDQATMAWWKSQSPEARRVLEESEHGGLSLPDALRRFGAFVGRAGGPRAARVWGCGANFDNAILGAAYDALGWPRPWQFWNDRCHRTLKAIAPKAAEPLREGTHHNALDDAVHQAKHACNVFWWIREGSRWAA